MKRSLSILSLLAVAVFTFSFTYTPPGKWEKLGSRKVNYGLDKDVIPVTALEGTFTKLKVQVTGGGLNMHKMVVHYGNGSKQEIALKHNFGRKSGSRIIDLKGGKRIIKKIVFWYDTKNLAKKKARVHVFARR